VEEIKNIWWDYLSLASSRIALVPLEFCAVAFTTHLLGAQQYGTIALFLSIVHLIFNFGVNWTSSAVVRFGRQEFVQTLSLHRTFSARTIIFVFSIGISFCFFYLFKDLVLGFTDVEEKFFWPLIVMTAVFAINNYINNLLQALSLFKNYSIVPLVEKTSYLALLAIFLLSGIEISILVIIALLILAKTLSMFYGGMSLRRISFFPFVFNPADIKRILIYSWPLIFAFSSGYVSDWFDLFVIKYFLSQSDVGIYQAAYQGMMGTSIFLYAISSIAFPTITMLRASKREDVIRSYVTRFSPQMVFFIGCFISSLMIIITPKVAATFWGGEFGEAAKPLMILLLCNSIMSISIIYTGILASYDLTLQMTLVSILMSAVNFLFDTIFIPLIGIKGAGIATFISYAFAAGAYFFMGNRCIGVRNGKIFLGVLPTLISSSICLATDSYFFRFITVLPLLIMSYIIISLTGWMSLEDYDLFAKNINIPQH
jgi:O-antigen/teichoic acid export membrane protein